jgi:hypothetical protein
MGRSETLLAVQIISHINSFDLQKQPADADVFEHKIGKIEKRASLIGIA